MNAKQLLLLGLAAFVVAVAAAEDVPEFCHGLDCPKYTVIRKTDAYELREYKKSAWVSTVVDGLTLETSLTTGFKRLYEYISGKNEDHRVINMTAPVRTRIEAGAGPFCRSNFTISFFVPFEFQLDEAPVPSNPDVYVDVAHRTTAYVAGFGGFAITPIVTSKAKNLTDTLRDEGIEVEESYYYLAGYDSPFRLTGRHNEIWVVEQPAGKQEQQQQASME